MNPIEIIDKFYPQDTEQRHILLIHSLSVAQKALKIVDAHPNLPINRSFVREAALLHDIQKGQPHHAEAAADILELMGCCRIAECIRYHKQLPPQLWDTVNESTLLYLADRLVIEDRRVNLSERFRQKAERFAGNPDALACLERDRKTAEHLYEMIRGEKP